MKITIEENGNVIVDGENSTLITVNKNNDPFKVDKPNHIHLEITNFQVCYENDDL